MCDVYTCNKNCFDANGVAMRNVVCNTDEFELEDTCDLVEGAVPRVLQFCKEHDDMLLPQTMEKCDMCNLEMVDTWIRGRWFDAYLTPDEQKKLPRNVCRLCLDYSDMCTFDHMNYYGNVSDQDYIRRRYDEISPDPPYDEEPLYGEVLIYNCAKELHDSWAEKMIENNGDVSLELYDHEKKMLMQYIGQSLIVSIRDLYLNK